MINKRGILILLLLLPLIPLTNSAEAVSGDRDFSTMFHRVLVGAGNQRNYNFLIFDTTQTNTVEPLKINSGDSFTVRCSYTNFGSPPPAPTNIDVYAYPDNVQFGNPGGGTPLWSIAFTSTCVSTGATEDVIRYCTNNGLVGGSPIYGGIRLVFRARNTGVTSYDINTDNGGTPNAGTDVVTIDQALLSCNPKITTLFDGNTASSPSVYIGGDTFRSGLIVDATYVTGSPTNPVTPSLVCSSFTATGSVITPTTSQVNTDYSIKGRTEYPDDCLLKQIYTINKKWSVTGKTTLDLFIWDTSSPISGAVYDSNLIARKDTKNLDRTLTPSAPCTFEISSVTIVVANRFENIDEDGCDWRNGRNARPPNNQLAIVYNNRATQTYTDTTDIASVNEQFSASGNLPTTVTVKTTATVSTNKLYRKAVDEFGASRTDAELLNWGVSCSSAPCDFDVSATYTDTNIVTSTDSDADPLTRTFISGEDLMYWYVDKLQNSRGAALSGIAISCERKQPDGTSDTVEAMGNTDANGDTTIHNLAVTAPLGVWSLICTASSNGNSYSHTISITHISPFSADINWGITVHAHDINRTHILLNITANPKVFDTESDNPVSLFPDGDVKTSVYIWDIIDNRYEPLYEREILLQSNQELLYLTFVVEKTTLKEEFDEPILVYVYGNLSMKPVMNSVYFNYFDKQLFRAEIEMNPYLTGITFVLIGLAVAFLPSRAKNPLLNVIALIVAIAGLTYGIVNLTEGPFSNSTINMSVIGLLFAAVFVYLCFKTLDESNNKTQEGYE
jgi:hypothetical protein